MNNTKYFKFLFLSVALIAALFFLTSCDSSNSVLNPTEESVPVSDLPALAKWTAADITYQISLVNFVYNSGSNTTTFTWSVTSNPQGGPAISHWDIFITEECLDAFQIVNSNDATASYGYDGSTGYTGLKFDTGYSDRETRQVTLTLAGNWTAGELEILVKAGNGFVLGSVQGPVCVADEPETYQISGTAFFDVNGNSSLNTDEIGLGNVTVNLFDGNGNVVATTLTDASGNYTFEDVEAGNYTVVFGNVDGLNFTTSSSLPVVVADSNLTNINAGYFLNLSFIGSQTANGFTIGYWKTNLKKAIDNVTKGVQVSKTSLTNYVSTISTLALYPLNVTTLSAAYNIVNANGSDDILLLSKQLLGSEFNYSSGAYIGGNQTLTYLFVYYGEYLIAHSTEYSRTQLLEAKDWFDAYNNSHGGLIILQ